MTRVAVLSDIHFGQLARTDYFAAPGERIKGNSSGDMPLGEGLIKLMNSMKPEYFFVAGDLTSAAEPQEFLYCEKKIMEIASEVGVKKENIICCAGNHDVDWKISNLFTIEEERFDSVDEVLAKRREKYQAIASNVARICMDELELAGEGPVPLSGVSEAEDFVVFVLNTSLKCGPEQKYSHGELTEKQLAWFEEQLKAYSSDSRKKIVLMHHHPFNYSFPTISEDISQIKEGAEFIEIAEKNGVDFVIHGHRHHPKVKTVLTEGYSPVTYFCAGSLAVNAEHRSNGEIPNTVHFIDIDKDKDYFVIYNYSYTGTEGWKKTHNTKATPMDDVMKVGKVFSEDKCREVLRVYKGKTEPLIKLEWQLLDESLQFLTYREVMSLINEELGEIYQIIGNFPEKVCLLRKEDGHEIC